jgi:hypothetical protein
LGYTFNSLLRFLTKRNVPFYFKIHIQVSIALNSVLYYIPLLGSNNKNIEKVQTSFNRGLFWSFGLKIILPMLLFIICLRNYFYLPLADNAPAGWSYWVLSIDILTCILLLRIFKYAFSESTSHLFFEARLV